MLFKFYRKLFQYQQALFDTIDSTAFQAGMTSSRMKRRASILALEQSAIDFYLEKAYEKSIEELDKAIALDQKLARRSFLMKSNCLMELGKNEEALAFAALGLGYASTRHQKCQTLNQIGYLWCRHFKNTGKRNHIELAIMMFEKAYQESSGDILPVVNLVLAHLDAASRIKKIKSEERLLFEQKARVWMDRVQNVPLREVDYNLKYLKIFIQDMKNRIPHTLDAGFWSRRLIDLAGQIAKRESAPAKSHSRKPGISFLKDAVLFLFLFVGLAVTSLRAQSLFDLQAEGPEPVTETQAVNIIIHNVQVAFASDSEVSIVVDLITRVPRLGGIGINDLAEIETVISQDPTYIYLTEQHPYAIFRITYFDSHLQSVITTHIFTI